MHSLQRKKENSLKKTWMKNCAQTTSYYIYVRGQIQVLWANHQHHHQLEISDLLTFMWLNLQPYHKTCDVIVKAENSHFHWVSIMLPQYSEIGKAWLELPGLICLGTSSWTYLVRVSKSPVRTVSLGMKFCVLWQWTMELSNAAFPTCAVTSTNSCCRDLRHFNSTEIVMC